MHCIELSGHIALQLMKRFTVASGYRRISLEMMKILVPVLNQTLVANPKASLLTAILAHDLIF
jgi:hypothetical protein